MWHFVLDPMRATERTMHVLEVIGGTRAPNRGRIERGTVFLVHPPILGEIGKLTVQYGTLPGLKTYLGRPHADNHEVLLERLVLHEIIPEAWLGRAFVTAWAVVYAALYATEILAWEARLRERAREYSVVTTADPQTWPVHVIRVPSAPVSWSRSLGLWSDTERGLFEFRLPEKVLIEHMRSP